MLLNRVEIDRRGRPAWNGTPLGGVGDTGGWSTLEAYLRISGQLEPVPAATLVFDRGTSCDAVERARALMRRHLACGDTWHRLQGAPS